MLEHVIRGTRQYGDRNAGDPESIHIVFGVDKNFVYPMGLTMTSILQHNQNVVFHVFIDDCPPPEDERPLRETIERYSAVCCLYVVDTTFFETLPTTSAWSIAMFFRFCVDYFYGRLDRVLYLDADIFCRGSLRDLFSMDMQGKAVAAVKDVIYIDDDYQLQMERIGHTGDAYFNSGVMLIDIRQWCQLSVTKKAFDMIRREPTRWRFPDQDVLNVLLQNRIYWLDARYDTMRPRLQEREKDAVLVHYIGHKPWFAWYIGVRPGYDEEFAELIRTSAWKGLIWEPRNTTECRLTARKCFHDGAYLEGLCWQMRYFKRKLFN